MHTRHIITVPTICSLEDAQKAILSGHNAFPVVNTGGYTIGLIPRMMIIVLINHKAFYDLKLIE